MPKTFLRLLALALCLLFLPLSASAQEDPLSILALNFPAFDLARAIAGDTACVDMLLPPGGESHSYEPTPQDIIAIQSADLFVYTGGESDHWIEEILSSMGDDAPQAFRLCDPVTLLAEETSESMEHMHEHDHEHCADETHGHNAQEMDEHVWTSPKNMMHIARSLCECLMQLAPQHQAFYADRLTQYLTELERLDNAFEEVVSSGSRDVIVFGDRFPFRYFAAAYGLKYDAAFPGCSEDSEPSVRTVISLVDKVRAEKIPVIFYIEFSSRRTADILAEETGASPLLFHSCHNVSAEEIETGASYLSLMWQNVQALKEALS